MDKSGIYREILPQIRSLTESESDLIANLANVSAVIHQAFQHHWTGFYLVRENELVLGPFQGPVACTRIAFGKGVCGTAWAKNQVQIVDNVHEFEGHIACSPFSNSEIVIPLSSNGQIWAVLDIDSTRFAAFDQTDAHYLCEICMLLNTSQ